MNAKEKVNGSPDAASSAVGEYHLEDRISQLPDEILIFILSSLRLKEAAATCVLSSRWIDLWAFRSRLNFDDTLSQHEISKKFIQMEWGWYVKWVNQVLKLCKSPTVEEFKIRMDLDERFTSDIDEWLKFALARGVQRLELDLSWGDFCHRGSRRFYTFPYKLLDQTKGTYKLRNLPSSFCSLRGCNFVGFKSIKELSLKNVNVSGKVLDDFLSNCPLLERLSVFSSFSKERKNFKVAGPSLMLKYLEICQCYSIESIEICNVNLVTLVYKGNRINLALRNVPLLVELSIDMVIYEELNVFLPRFSCLFSQLETLTLEIVGDKDFSGFHGSFEFTNLKKLVLITTNYHDTCLLGYTCFIKASPLLQKFVLQVESWGCVSEREIRKAERCPHEHLEEVEWAGYSGLKSDIELVMYFVENAVALKKIIVCPDSGTYAKRRTAKPEHIIEKEKVGLSRAKQQLEGKLPEGIELLFIL